MPPVALRHEATRTYCIIIVGIHPVVVWANALNQNFCKKDRPNIAANYGRSLAIRTRPVAGRLWL